MTTPYRTCPICSHPDLTLIDRQLLAEIPVREITQKYPEFKYTAVEEHKKSHIKQLYSPTDISNLSKAIDDIPRLTAKTPEGLREWALQIQLQTMERLIEVHAATGSLKAAEAILKGQVITLRLAELMETRLVDQTDNTLTINIKEAIPHDEKPGYIQSLLHSQD